MPWHQFANAVDRMTLRDLSESVADISLRVEAVELRCLHDRVDRCGALTADVGTSEEVVLAPERDAADGILGDVVVGFEAAVVEEPAEHLAPSQSVSESIGQWGLGRELGQRPGSPTEEAVDQRCRLGALLHALVRRNAARRGLNRIDRRDPVQRFLGDRRLSCLPDVEDLPAAMRPGGNLDDRSRPMPMLGTRPCTA